MATATRPAAADTATSLREAVRHDGVHANSDSAAPVRGAAAAPPRQAGNNASRSAVRNGGGIKFGFLDLAGLQHCLRLRKTFAVTDALSGEVGLDYTLNTRAAVPQYSLAYQARRQCKFQILRRAWSHGMRNIRPGALRKVLAHLLATCARWPMLTQCACAHQLQRKGRNFATLRATPQMLMLRKSFTFSPSKISFTLHTMAGVTYEGAPLACFLLLACALSLHTLRKFPYIKGVQDRRRTRHWPVEYGSI